MQTLLQGLSRRLPRERRKYRFDRGEVARSAEFWRALYEQVAPRAHSPEMAQEVLSRATMEQAFSLESLGRIEARGAIPSDLRDEAHLSAFWLGLKGVPEEFLDECDPLIRAVWLGTHSEEFSAALRGFVQSRDEVERFLWKYADDAGVSASVQEQMARELSRASDQVASIGAGVDRHGVAPWCGAEQVRVSTSRLRSIIHTTLSRPQVYATPRGAAESREAVALDPLFAANGIMRCGLASPAAAGGF